VPRIEKPQLLAASGPDLPATPTLGKRFDFVVSFLRRRYLAVLIPLLLSLALGGLYLFKTPPTYTASATILIEPRKGLLQQTLGGDPPTDVAWIESQIGVLKSQNVASYVVKQLRLVEDPQFIRSGDGLIDQLLAGLDQLLARLDQLLARLGWQAEPKTEADHVGETIAAFMKQLDVRRIGTSYLMRIDFRSRNREQAVKIVNTMIDAYILDQLNAKYQANRRTGDWLQERLQTLREQAAASERAVIEFKAKNNIVAASGTLMNEKQLSEMSGRLATARANTTDVQVRLERIEAVRRAYQEDKPGSAADETVSEAMSSGIINKLRDRYLDLVNREADWSARYGKNHTAVVNLRNQIRDMRRSIFDELGRIQEQFKSEYEIAKKRQDELEKALVTLVSQSTETNQAQVALFSLEAAAQSYRKIYDNFLQQHTVSIQQQTFPVTEARQTSAGSAIKTAPKPLQVCIVAIFAGGMLGVGLGAFREIRDRGFRTREQVRTVLATECLALVPLLPDDRRKRFLSSRQSLAMEPIGKAQLAVAHRALSCGPKSMRTIVDSPSSAYAEAVRSIKLTVDLNSQDKFTKVIGLTSCLPSEGKSSLAAAMASLIAQGGARVVLVDCDVRNPSLSRALAPKASSGFLDVVAGKVGFEDAVWNDSTTNMAFLPAGRWVPNASEILASDKAKLLFETLQIKYDYVIVDLAPLVAGVGVRATSRLIDSYVLVIEWGATKIDEVQYALRHAPGVQENIVGAVLNKVNMAAMSRYDSYGADNYYVQPRHSGSMN
jgi:polysaccharide biosynthesis transport protein